MIIHAEQIVHNHATYRCLYRTSTMCLVLCITNGNPNWMSIVMWDRMSARSSRVVVPCRVDECTYQQVPYRRLYTASRRCLVVNTLTNGYLWISESRWYQLLSTTMQQTQSTASASVGDLRVDSGCLYVYTDDGEWSLATVNALQRPCMSDSSGTDDPSACGPETDIFVLEGYFNGATIHDMRHQASRLFARSHVHLATNTDILYAMLVQIDACDIHVVVVVADIPRSDDRYDAIEKRLLYIGGRTKLVIVNSTMRVPSALYTLGTLYDYHRLRSQNLPSPVDARTRKLLVDSGGTDDYTHIHQPNAPRSIHIVVSPRLSSQTSARTYLSHLSELSAGLSGDDRVDDDHVFDVVDMIALRRQFVRIMRDHNRHSRRSRDHQTTEKFFYAPVTSTTVVSAVELSRYTPLVRRRYRTYGHVNVMLFVEDLFDAATFDVLVMCLQHVRGSIQVVYAYASLSNAIALRNMEYFAQACKAYFRNPNVMVVFHATTPPLSWVSTIRGYVDGLVTPNGLGSSFWHSIGHTFAHVVTHAISEGVFRVGNLVAKGGRMIGHDLVSVVKAVASATDHSLSYIKGDWRKILTTVRTVVGAMVAVARIAERVVADVAFEEGVISFVSEVEVAGNVASIATVGANVDIATSIAESSSLVMHSVTETMGTSIDTIDGVAESISDTITVVTDEANAAVSGLVDAGSDFVATSVDIEEDALANRLVENFSAMFENTADFAIEDGVLEDADGTVVVDGDPNEDDASDETEYDDKASRSVREDDSIAITALKRAIQAECVAYAHLAYIAHRVALLIRAEISLFAPIEDAWSTLPIPERDGLSVADYMSEVDRLSDDVSSVADQQNEIYHADVAQCTSYMALVRILASIAKAEHDHATRVYQLNGSFSEVHSVVKNYYTSQGATAGVARIVMVRKLHTRETTATHHKMLSKYAKTVVVIPTDVGADVEAAVASAKHRMYASLRHESKTSGDIHFSFATDIVGGEASKDRLVSTLDVMRDIVTEGAVYNMRNDDTNARLTDITPTPFQNLASVVRNQLVGMDSTARDTLLHAEADLDALSVKMDKCQHAIRALRHVIAETHGDLVRSISQLDRLTDVIKESNLYEPAVVTAVEQLASGGGENAKAVQKIELLKNTASSLATRVVRLSASLTSLLSGQGSTLVAYSAKGGAFLRSIGVGDADVSSFAFHLVGLKAVYAALSATVQLKMQAYSNAQGVFRHECVSTDSQYAAAYAYQQHALCMQVAAHIHVDRLRDLQESDLRVSIPISTALGQTEQEAVVGAVNSAEMIVAVVQMYDYAHSDEWHNNQDLVIPHESRIRYNHAVYVLLLETNGALLAGDVYQNILEYIDNGDDSKTSEGNLLSNQRRTAMVRITLG